MSLLPDTFNRTCEGGGGGPGGGALPDTKEELLLFVSGIESKRRQAMPFGTSLALKDQKTQRGVLPHALQQASTVDTLTSSKCLIYQCAKEQMFTCSRCHQPCFSYYSPLASGHRRLEQCDKQVGQSFQRGHVESC